MRSLLALLLLCTSLGALAGNGALPDSSYRVAAFHDTLQQFTGKELSLYLKTWGDSKAAPSTMLGEPVKGEYFATSFAVSLAAYGNYTQQGRLNEYELATWCRDLIQQDVAGETFGQLNMLRAMMAFSRGPKLDDNLLWQQCSPQLRQQIIEMANWHRSVEPATLKPAKGRPQNYCAVGALIAAHAVHLGLSQDREGATRLLNHCIGLMTASKGFIDDDNGGRGRYDRYGLEFQRFCWEAAALLKDKKARKTLLPMVRNGMQYWADAYNPATGHAAPFGRSLQNAWDDCWETVGLMAEYPELRVMSMPQLAACYARSWHVYTTKQYNPTTHLNRMLESGRQTYSYAGRNRIWQYSVHSFGKALFAARQLETAMAKERMGAISTRPQLPDVSRLQVFRTRPRIMAHWLYRKGDMYFVMPLIGGFKNAGQSDYLPVPYGFPGLEHPVALGYPYLTPHITLSNQMVLVNANGVDSLALSTDGNSLRTFSKYLPNLQGDLVDPGFTVTRTLTVEGALLTEEQVYRVTGTEPVIIAKWQMGLATHYTDVQLDNGRLTTNGRDYLEPQLEAVWQPAPILHTTGHDSKIKGAFNPITITLEWVAKDFVLSPQEDYKVIFMLRKNPTAGAANAKPVEARPEGK